MGTCCVSLLLAAHADRSLCCAQRSISLSAQQKKELLAGRHYYLSKMSEVLRQREGLLATLEVRLSQDHMSVCESNTIADSGLCVSKI